MLGQLSAKTLIYVTHQVEFLPAADLILVSDVSLIVFSKSVILIICPTIEFGNISSFSFVVVRL